MSPPFPFFQIWMCHACPGGQLGCTFEAKIAKASYTTCLDHLWNHHGVNSLLIPLLA